MAENPRFRVRGTKEELEACPDKVKKFNKRIKENVFPFFGSLCTIWFVFISFHFYYLIIRLDNNGLININKLMNTFKSKMIVDYLWIVLLPFSMKIIYYFSLRKPLLNKPFSEKEKREVRLVFKTLIILFVIALLFTIIFK